MCRAPAAPPYERKLPDTIYDVERSKEGRSVTIHKTLDADRDGRPEIEIVYDDKSGEILRRSEDTDYDGALDTHNTYEKGEIAVRTEEALRGKKMEEPLIQEAAQIAAKEARPLVDTNYKREMMKVFTRRAVTQAWQGSMPVKRQ